MMLTADQRNFAVRAVDMLPARPNGVPAAERQR
jgi:hypothetical protein